MHGKECLMMLNTHVIFGVEKATPETFLFLRKRGKRDIYVMDYDQVERMRKVDGIYYISVEWAMKFMPANPKIVAHHFIDRRRK